VRGRATLHAAAAPHARVTPACWPAPGLRLQQGCMALPGPWILGPCLPPSLPPSLRRLEKGEPDNGLAQVARDHLEALKAQAAGLHGAAAQHEAGEAAASGHAGERSGSCWLAAGRPAAPACGGGGCEAPARRLASGPRLCSWAARGSGLSSRLMHSGLLAVCLPPSSCRSGCGWLGGGGGDGDPAPTFL